VRWPWSRPRPVYAFEGVETRERFLELIKMFVEDRCSMTEAMLKEYTELLLGTPQEIMEALQEAGRDQRIGSIDFAVLGKRCHPRIYQAYMALARENAALKKRLE